MEGFFNLLISALEFFIVPDKAFYTLLVELNPSFIPALINIAIILSFVTCIGLVLFLNSQYQFVSSVSVLRIKEFLGNAPGGIPFVTIVGILLVWFLIIIFKPLFIMVGLYYVLLAFLLSKGLLFITAIFLGRWSAEKLFLSSIVFVSAFLIGLLVRKAGLSILLSFILLILSAFVTIRLMNKNVARVNVFMVIGFFSLIVLSGLLEGSLTSNFNEDYWYMELMEYGYIPYLKYSFPLGVLIGIIQKKIKN